MHDDAPFKDKMIVFLRKNHRLVFYGCWLLLSFLQAYFTQLQDDEAYYWVFSKFLSWGYFDHPPLIALLIKIGTVFLPGELGVRIFPLFLTTLSLIITEKLIESKSPFLFYAVCLSLPVLQIAGFVAVPDIPLIFFTSLFFFVYRSFTKSNSLWDSILLGLTMAGLLYSKYQGILVIFFTLLSNIKLLKRKGVYIACITALLLFTPHLVWEYNHDWISIRFHFFERNTEQYDFGVTIEYLLGQLVVAGPLAAIIVFTGTFLFRTNNLAEKAMQYSAIGIFSFFLISTLKGRVEANWTSPAIVPMIVLTHNYLIGHIKWRRWLYRLLPLTVMLTMAFRFFMVVDVLPVTAIKERFHEWKNWPIVLRDKTKNLPVVFKNSYQRASQYWFHTGQTAYSLNDYRERMNNYNLWPIEDSLIGKKVFVMDIYEVNLFKDSLRARLWNIGFSQESNFHSFAKVLVHPAFDNYLIDSGAGVSLSFKVHFPPLYRDYLRQHPESDEPVVIGLFKGKARIKDINTGYTVYNLMQASIQKIKIFPGLKPGKYFLLFAVATSTNLFTANSRKIWITVK